MMEAANALGGGPARIAVPKLFALPTSGLKSLFSQFASGTTPPLTSRVSVPAAAEAGFVADYMLPTYEARGRDPFYNEFLRPGRAWHEIAAFLDETPAGALRLLIFREETQGRFERDELDALGHTLPYLRSAAMISRGTLSTAARCQAEPFDRRGEPVLYLSPDARVMDLNEAGRAANGDTFDIVKGRIETPRASDQRRLDRALHATLSDRRPSLVSLQNRGGVVALMALVLPVDGEARDVFQAISAIVVMIDRRRRIGAETAAIGLLNHAAGLTARELDVVRRVGVGRSARLASEDLAMSYGTLRNHLKAAFGKLGVHSQAELVALVQRLC